MQGIDRITCDFKTNSVSISGSQDAVDALKAEIKRADIQPTVCRIDMKIVRFQVDTQGKYTETVEQPPIITTVSNVTGSKAVTSALGGISVSATPAPGGNKNSTTLSVELQELGAQGEVVKSGKNVRV